MVNDLWMKVWTGSVYQQGEIFPLFLSRFLEFFTRVIHCGYFLTQFCTLWTILTYFSHYNPLFKIQLWKTRLIKFRLW